MLDQRAHLIRDRLFLPPGPAVRLQVEEVGAATRRERDVFCYFDNDTKVRAPFDADRLMKRLGLQRPDPGFRFPGRQRLRKVRPVTPLPPFRWRRPGTALRKAGRG